jgi:hypothetical protein
MSDSDSISHQQVPQSAMPSASAKAGSWRQVFKPAKEQFKPKPGSREPSRSPAADNPGFSMHALLSRKLLMVSLFLFALASILAFAIFRFATRPATVKQARMTVSSGKSLLGLTPTDKPKPAPGKPFVAETQSSLPVPTVWKPAPGSPQSPWTPGTPPGGLQIPANPQQFPTAPQAAPPVGAPPPVQPAVPANGSQSAFAPLVYQARHERHFGGCAGQLTLSAAGLTFHCADDPEDSFQVALNQIGAVDENGIQLLSGKKYHFSIAGMNKNTEQALFANWLHRVRR